MKNLSRLGDEKLDRAFVQYLPLLKGKIIVFEGINGSGKTTYANMLGKMISDTGHDVLVTQEPGHIPVDWKSVKSLDPTAQCLLYLADRAEHIKSVIQPALDSSRIVICDRFFDSSYAYHSECSSMIKHFNLSVLSEIRTYIYRIFWLDLSPDIAANIVAEREKKSVGVVPKNLEDFRQISDRYKQTMGMSPVRKRHRISLPSRDVMREIKQSLVFGDGGFKLPDESDES